MSERVLRRAIQQVGEELDLSVPEKETIFIYTLRQLGDASTIANAAITLAADRTKDLEIQPLIPLFLLRELVDIMIAQITKEMEKGTGMSRKRLDEMNMTLSKVLKAYVQDSTHDVLLS